MMDAQQACLVSMVSYSGGIVRFSREEGYEKGAVRGREECFCFKLAYFSKKSVNKGL